MADQKITALTADTSPTTDDLVVTVNDPLGTPANKKVTLDNVGIMEAAVARTLTNKTVDSTSPTAFNPPGIIQPYGARKAPTGWLNCDGSAISRTTYAALFAIIAASLGTVTITNASPGVVTNTAHGLSTGDQIYLTTTGGLPTGLSANTLYYIIRVDANSYNLATSRANAYAATKINTSSAGSGTHTAWDCPYGLGDGSTTFTLPDLRGRTPSGLDTTSGTAASRLTLAQSQGVYGNLGASGGEQGHQLIISEMPSHTHTINFNQGNNSAGSPGVLGTQTVTQPTSSTGGDGSHNTVPPTQLVNYIIKT